MPRTIALICILGWALASCAGLQSEDIDARGESSLCASEYVPPDEDWEAPDLPPNWVERPLLVADRVATPADAARLLPFAPVVPSELGQPKSIFVIPPYPNDPSVAALGVVYEHPDCGRFHMTQRLAQVDQETLERQAEGCDPEKGCQGRGTVVPLGSGIRASQLEGPVANSIAWVHRGMYFDILGPSETLGPTDLQELAEIVIRAAETER